MVREKPSRSDQLVFTEPETKLIEALLGVQGRGRGVSSKQLQDVESAVQALEISKGVPDPTSSSMIEGSWQLIFTTRPGTASPIQRTFVAVDSFKIFQEVYLRTDDPRVTNVVKFSDLIGELRVEAGASIKDGKRILFRFDRAAFSFKFLPFKVPYPVPFRLLGDEAKGWLDTTYLSDTGNIRISKGNKGTTFVLQKATEPRQKLLSAISSGEGILEAIEEFTLYNKVDSKGDFRSLVGEWQLLWASESGGESWSDISRGLKGVQTIKEDGQVANWAVPFPGSRVTATGTLEENAKSKAYSVLMKEGVFQFGPLKLPFDVQENLVMEILYVDNKIRIGSIDKATVVHLRL
ncbi:Plastid-lipid associated protein PAP / fibrillin family protein [Rhynchospora pubera]|uniref:Plastid-lipid associated protein PAP / fibrillin family protein n=1 Tax=Rhynchospora pubera TaxID=906938 RepID=A0AAV8F131_9POAL|nr:Plastid-lipid associated protein PAP / fibrillin family protein [Rhynchospora pubera]